MPTNKSRRNQSINHSKQHCWCNVLGRHTHVSRSRGCTLLVGELGLLLADERSHALLLVGGGKGRVEELALVLEALAQAELERLVDALLGHSHYTYARDSFSAGY